MMSRKLNVLVYNGPGATVESVKQALHSLRYLLEPNYAVTTINQDVLLAEPWMPTCALLVFPGGADRFYCQALDGRGNAKITTYVRAGGNYMGFCAGSYYASKCCEFELDDPVLAVRGDRELAFFPGVCRGSAYKGFQYRSEVGARAIQLAVDTNAFDPKTNVPKTLTSYYNGGGVFVKADQADHVQVLAAYADDLNVSSDDNVRAAVVYCKVEQGAAILSGPHPEFSEANLTAHKDIAGYDDLRARLREDDTNRVSFLEACLLKLGLKVNEEPTGVPPLSRLHLSSLREGDVDDVLFALESIITNEDGEEYIRAEQDVFHIQKDIGLLTSTPRYVSHEEESEGGKAVSDDPTVLDVVTYQDRWPEAKTTPYFNHGEFFTALRTYRKQVMFADADMAWGDHLLYGEVVTSTNTLLDRNHKLLSKLPGSGFTVTATTQVAGRGRGSNVWVSPKGSLIMSTVISHPMSIAFQRPIVFLQYLAAIAIVQAILHYGPRGENYRNIPVRIKWPNDIYAKVYAPGRTEAESWVKIGGILSNATYSGNQYQVVLGIGINVSNEQPTVSLNSILSSLNGKKESEPFTIEKLTAHILVRLESLYKDFCRDGFTTIMENRYYESWLHTGQHITIDAESGAKARVEGITRDWGLLKAQELDKNGRVTGKSFTLQSDENSFDFFRGLIKRKA
ncbi:class II aaRS and biotin synthetase [Xylariaceae sp. FL0016]|nr:class II aaRS and biotin synthetase [Xylariaceae sp. FL0016]